MELNTLLFFSFLLLIKIISLTLTSMDARQVLYTLHTGTVANQVFFFFFSFFLFNYFSLGGQVVGIDEWLEGRV
ncbi:hypothetical protein QBC43DRAFT_309686, partial [Cladorrhinum sp. PSN259]